MEKWILILIVLICVILLIAFGFALWSGQKKQSSPKKVSNRIPTAKELLELLQDNTNTLADLKAHSNTACANYEHYMQEQSDFDLEFVAILTAHKSVNAKLILEVERNFKSINPARKTLLDQALSLGLGNR
ncbi:hypothetical protein [uncultured Helicobacter sp.]|uniref:hypothetical protein n=1 Tax=uncultured Helicobacter sp. TaxID=175537 RepID=UPI0026078250|nr:hypothetical protein [uncultured Helicobacter sp.]